LKGLRSETTVLLAEWIEAKKLAVETILPVHGKVITFEEFRQDAANFRKARKQ
jgi:hypothetical protein